MTSSVFSTIWLTSFVSYLGGRKIRLTKNADNTPKITVPVLTKANHKKLSPELSSMAITVTRAIEIVFSIFSFKLIVMTITAVNPMMIGLGSKISPK